MWVENVEVIGLVVDLLGIRGEKRMKDKGKGKGRGVRGRLYILEF